MEESICRIPLVHGGEAIIDEDDLCRVDEYRWERKRFERIDYAVTRAMKNGVNTSVFMHRLILGLTKEDRVHVDHANHDGLDNRRRNLRLATPKQNAANSRKRSGTRSKYVGVSKITKSAEWMARIEIREAGARRSVALGYYHVEEEAAFAYQLAAGRLRDVEFLHLTPIPEDRMPCESRQQEIRADINRRLAAFLERKKVRRNATSRYTGVFQNRKTLKWFFMFRHDGNTISLGPFRDEHEAAWAFNTAIRLVPNPLQQPITVVTEPSQERQAVIRAVVGPVIKARLAGIKGALPNRFALSASVGSEAIVPQTTFQPTLAEAKDGEGRAAHPTLEF